MVELRGECLVVRQHQGRTAQLFDQLGHRERLAGSRDTEQNLVLFTVVEAAPEFRDRRSWSPFGE